jgi:hypothetical protein
VDIASVRLQIDGPWVKRFKRKRGIVIRKKHGDSAGVDMEVVDHFLATKVLDIFRRYNLEDIYNGDEWGMFWNTLPSYGPIQGKEKVGHGVKQKKDRLTAFVAVSMLGDFSPALVVGKYEHPQALKGLKEKDLPVIYLWNRIAWMTCFVFLTYLKAWNRRLRKANRCSAPYVDNCSAHLLSEELSNIEIVLYPPGCTSLLQALDASIIKEIKSHYKCKLMMEYLEVCF